MNGLSAQRGTFVIIIRNARAASFMKEKKKMKRKGRTTAGAMGMRDAKLNVITAPTPRAESALATTVPFFARIVYNSTIP